MKIAVVGGGISGLSAALILNKHHDVHLFESENRLGGHAHTVHTDSGREQPVAVDTGFLVYNTLTYPHFTRFLDHLGVKSAASDMTLSIKSVDGVEWGGANLRSIFAQRKNTFRFSFLKMLSEILRFNRDAQKNLELSREYRWTLGDLIKNQNYSSSFQTLYLLPMTGAIWSMSNTVAMQFPAETFLTFCMNHKLLQVGMRPTWRTIIGGSINYVSNVEHRLSNVHTGTPVRSIRKKGSKLVLSINGVEAEFDKVIFATHAPVTRKILNTEFRDLENQLQPMKVSTNRVVLHQDASIMPNKKACWSAWNVRTPISTSDNSHVCLTYFINKLQPLNSDRQHFVTLNSPIELRKVQRQFDYDHPQFDFDAINFQKKLPSLQGTHGIYFAGAWTRYGFHEDGILSAVNIAKSLGVEAPWN